MQEQGFDTGAQESMPVRQRAMSLHIAFRAEQRVTSFVYWQLR